MPLRCAIIGSGNIGTDLMVKMLRSSSLQLTALVGIDPASDGLARAASLGLDAPHEGPDWILDHADDFDMIFDATSAYVHVRYYKKYADAGITAIDLTPAARGPKVIAAVNLTANAIDPEDEVASHVGKSRVVDHRPLRQTGS